MNIPLMLSRLSEPNCSREAANMIAPKLVSAIGVMTPSLAIASLSALTARGHPEARSLAMQMETYWLTKQSEPEKKPCGGGLYCPMRPMKTFNNDVVASLTPDDCMHLKSALSLVQGADILKEQLDEL